MSNRSEVVITAEGRMYHLGIAPGEIAKCVFLVGDPDRAYRVAERFDSVECEINNREYVTLNGSCRGIPLSVVGTGIGTDNVEIALIELDAAYRLDPASGRRKPGMLPMDLIRIGTSGGVQPDVPAGTLCIAEYALGLDSTGPYYDVRMADDVVAEIETEAMRLLSDASESAARFGGRLPVYASRADGAVTTALARHALLAQVPFELGITASSPGFYGPSSRFVEGLTNTVPDIKGTLARLDVQGRRVLNMEMESSLLFHLATALGHRTGTICAAISQPGAAAALVDYEGCIENAIGLAIDAMLELQQPVANR